VTRISEDRKSPLTDDEFAHIVLRVKTRGSGAVPPFRSYE